MTISDELDEKVRALGFESGAEFCELVAKTDISTPQNRGAFRKWQYTDGSKTGLLKLERKPEPVNTPPNEADKPTKRKKAK
jgi:hypothetical protein